MNHFLEKEDVLFLFIDMQDSLIKAMDQGDKASENARILSAAAEVMDIDCVYTTQYKKGLGDFNEEIRSARTRATDYDKMAFSAMLEDDFVDLIQEAGKKTIVVSGMETHVCCLMTVRDLLAAGYHVVAVADAMDSRDPIHKRIALEEMRDMGAVVRSAETILFDLNSISGTDEFKAVQKLIK